MYYLEKYLVENIKKKKKIELFCNLILRFFLVFFIVVSFRYDFVYYNFFVLVFIYCKGFFELDVLFDVKVKFFIYIRVVIF